MEIFDISFAGHQVRFRYTSDLAATFLNFLFSDLSCSPATHFDAELFLVRQGDSEIHRISSATENLFEGALGVQAAALLFDLAIFNLLNFNKSGVALHAGAVSHKGELLIIPGESGAGKSSVVAWLASHGFSYATDELVFFRNRDMNDTVPFTRPICLKTGSAQAFSAAIPDSAGNWLRDASGTIIPHRALDQSPPPRPQSPKLLLFPSYQKHAPTETTPISGAQAATRLMACCANGRNLNGHGFKEIVVLARSLPAYQLTFSTFDGLETAVERLVQPHSTVTNRP